MAARRRPASRGKRRPGGAATRLRPRGEEGLHGDGVGAAEGEGSSPLEYECAAYCPPDSLSRVFEGASQGRGSAERRGAGAPLAVRVGVWTI